MRQFPGLAAQIVLLSYISGPGCKKFPIGSLGGRVGCRRYFIGRGSLVGRVHVHRVDRHSALDYFALGIKKLGVERRVVARFPKRDTACRVPTPRARATVYG